MRALKLMGSWWITAALVLAAAAPYVYFAFGEDPYGRWSHFMLHTPPGLVLYAAFVFQVVLASARVLVKRFEHVRLSREAVTAMDAWVEIDAGQSPESVSGWLSEKGFKAHPVEGGIEARKGRFSFIPGTVMRLGLVVFMVSLLVSTHVRRSEEVLLGEGWEADVMGRKVKLIGVAAPLPGEFLQVSDRDVFRLGRVEARLAMSGSEFAVTAGYPAESGGLLWRVTHVGYMRRLRAGSSEREVALDVLPPGRTQALSVAGGGPEYVLRLLPEKTLTKGLLKGSLYNLADPRFGLKLKAGPGAVTLRTGQEAVLGGVPVSLEGGSLYVKVLSVYDPALPWLRAGLILTVAGMFLMLSRFFWYEKRCVAVFSEGPVLLGYEEEFFRKWGIYKFRKWSGEFRPD